MYRHSRTLTVAILSVAALFRCAEMPGESLRVSQIRLTVLKVGRIG